MNALELGMVALRTAPVSVQVKPLSAVMGAEVSGIDLAAGLDDAGFAAIQSAFLQHKLLRFRGQTLREAQQVAFSRRFGELQVHVLDQFRHPEHPEIYVLSNVDKGGKTTGRHPDRGTLVWHSDLSFQRRPALATILYGIAVPRQGGETLFADMVAAYDALPETMKHSIADLRAIHDLDYSRTRAGEPPMNARQRAEAPPVDHPLVRTHPDTGQKLLYISNHVSHMQGMPVEDGRALLDELMVHATQEKFIYRNTWESGDVVMWDNRCTMHRATEYDAAGERRIIHRTVVKGEVPV